MDELEKKDIEILKYLLDVEGKNLLGIDRYEKNDRYWENLNATLSNSNINEKDRHTSKFLFDKFPNKQENTIIRLGKLQNKGYIYCHILYFKKEEEVESISITPLGKEFIQNYKIKEKDDRKSFIIKDISVPVITTILTNGILAIIKNFKWIKDLIMRGFK